MATRGDCQPALVNQASSLPGVMAHVVQEKEEQVASALQQVTVALAERTQREQSFMERYVATLDENQQQLAEQYIADAASYNALIDKFVPHLH